jgi:hypothetical protein
MNEEGSTFPSSFSASSLRPVLSVKLKAFEGLAVDTLGAMAASETAGGEVVDLSPALFEPQHPLLQAIITLELE